MYGGYLYFGKVCTRVEVDKRVLGMEHILLRETSRKITEFYYYCLIFVKLKKYLTAFVIHTTIILINNNC